jgi:aldose 1-epimerase
VDFDAMVVDRRVFGRLPDGRRVDLFRLKAGDVIVEIINYGGIIRSIVVPDSNGVSGDIVHGFEDLEGYLGANPWFGSICGRYASRIAGGRFGLDGVEYRLAQNDGANHLHGGFRGFDKALWGAQMSNSSLILSYTSRDGEEGYPGNLTARVTYTASRRGELVTEYEASTDKPTVVNLMNHTYFNLECRGDILSHEVTLHASYFTPVRSDLIPTGEIVSVKGTPMDFTSPTRIGEHINSPYEQIINGKGYDCNWILDGKMGELRLAAEVYDSSSGRRLEISTTQPGVQFYTGNMLDGSIRGKGRTYGWRSGLCLETQHFPDSPNQPRFPSTVLRPGERYREKTVYRFHAA